MSWSPAARLYHEMMTQSKRFPNYMFRAYALRRIRDAFRENATVKDAATIEQLMQSAHRSLAIIRRQTSIGQMYKTTPFAIEKVINQRST